MGSLLLELDHFLESLFVDRPSWYFLFFTPQVANICEVLHSFRSSILLAFLFLAISLIHECSWWLHMLHPSDILPLLLFLNPEDLSSILIIDCHLVSLFKLAVRADLFAVLLICDNILRTDLLEFRDV